MKTRAFYISILMLMFFTMPLHGSRRHVAGRETAASTAATPPEFIVTGQGAPRSELGQCERDLAQFQKALKAIGLQTLEAPNCVGNDVFYFPTFRARSTINLALQTIEGGRFNSLTYCELQGQRMAFEQSKNSRILETGCKQLGTNDVFQPIVILLREPLSGEAE